MTVSTDQSVKIGHALAGLRQVLDPEIGLNVVDLGLVYQLDINEDVKTVFAIMTLTTRFCPMGHSLVDGVENNLRANFQGYDVQVSVAFDPPWSQAMISQEGIDFLNR